MASNISTAIKAILFDLDDTLWPTATVIAYAEQTLHAWLSQHAPLVAALSIEQLRQKRQALVAANPYFKIDLWALRQQLLHEVFAEVGEVDSDGSRARQAMQVFARARSEVQMFDDVKPALAALEKQWHLGSISNGFANLQQIGIAQHFKVSLAAHEFGCAKPDPSIFLAACQALQVAPEETLFVGDDLLLDVQGAQQAGLQAIWLRRDLAHVKAQEHASHSAHVRAQAVCADLFELHTWLDGHCIALR